LEAEFSYLDWIGVYAFNQFMHRDKQWYSLFFWLMNKA
jgi:hypothetical protein